MARSRVWEFVKKVGRDLDDQFWKKSGPHGASELSAAMFSHSNAHVMYGHGHSGPSADGRQANETQQPKGERAEQADAQPEQQADREKGGRER